jgi:hypothetical protein
MRILGFSRRSRQKRKWERFVFRDLLSVSRREFIAGAASTAAMANPGYAEENAVEFSIQENDSEITINFRNARCLTPLTFKIAKSYWTICSSEVDSTASRTCKPPKFLITDATAKPMPDGSNRRTVTIDIQNAAFAGQNAFAAKFVFQVVDQDCQLSLTMAGWPSPGKTRFAPVDFIEFMLDSRLRVALTASETSKLVQALFGSSLKSLGKGELAIGKDLSWTLYCPFSVPLGLDASSASRLSFDRLRFAPTSNNTSPFSKEILGAAFPKLFEKEDAVFSPPPGLAGYSEGALQGDKVAELGRHGKVLVSAHLTSQASVAFLQFGQPAETVSGVSGNFNVWIKQDQTEGPFLTEGATIARHSIGGASGFARMPISSKPFEVTTAYGRFCLEAADPTIPQPGFDEIRPGVTLSTDKGELKSFEIAALIRQAFVPFPADAFGSGRMFFSRLDFSGADCKFVLDSLADLTPIYSSGSFVRLCAPAEAPAGRDPIRLVA